MELNSKTWGWEREAKRESAGARWRRRPQARKKAETTVVERRRAGSRRMAPRRGLEAAAHRTMATASERAAISSRRSTGRVAVVVSPDACICMHARLVAIAMLY